MVQVSFFSPKRELHEDFRTDAAEASVKIVERNRGLPPNDASLCLPVSEANVASMRNFGYGVVARLIIGILGIVVGGVIAFYTDQAGDEGGQVQASDTSMIAVAVCFSLTGFLALFSNPFLQARFVRRQLGQRYDEMISADLPSKPISVGIEDPATFQKMKMVGEDLGFLVIKPDDSLILVEGVGYRYIVHAQDVISVSEAAGPSCSATTIQYTVGNTQLGIAIQTDSIWHEVKKQTVGVKEDALVSRIRDALN